jgi:kynureninase
MDPEFVPRAGADGWQVSNPPILAMAPLKAALAIFDEAGPEALRRKSMVLTGYLEYLVDRLEPRLYEVITPRDPPARGCQLSLRAGGKAREIQKALEKKGVITDFREPDVIRVAPFPLYNQFHEVWRFSRILAEIAASPLFRDQP